MTAALAFVSCSDVAESPKSSKIEPSPQELIDKEVGKVTLAVAGKENITAEELTSKRITASGFNTTRHTIAYQNIKGDNAQRKADVTFRLTAKKGAFHSKERTVTIEGFKAKETSATPSPQELINKEVGKVTLTVPNKRNITAGELTEAAITASEFDNTKYKIEYQTIDKDNKKRTAKITFRLAEIAGSLQSTERTITIEDFKEPLPAVTLTADELTSAFSLEKGSVTASAAAKKAVAMKSSTHGAFQFGDIAIVNYDDKSGTFALKIEGKKDGVPFNTTVDFTGFSHPLAGKHLQSLIGSGLALNFEEAIEGNYSLTKYIAAVNADATGARFLPGYSFTLDDVHTTVSLGEHDDYMLSAKLSADGANKVKVTPKLTYIYHKKNDSAAAETIESVPHTTIVPQRLKSTVPYFTEKDVFKHILNKLNDDFIKRNTDIFASSLYASATALEVTPEEVFDLEKIKKYVELYQAPEPDKHDKHLQVKDITAAIYGIKNGGIAANDDTGTLTVKCCIATKEQIAKLSDGSSQTSSGITAVKELSRSDFKKADQVTLKSMFEFKIEKEEGKTAEEAKEKWKNASQLPGTTPYPLLSGDNYSVQSLPSLSSMSCRMTVNAGDNPKDYFACNSKTHLSKSTSGTEILLKKVLLQKQAEDLQVTFELCNEHQINVTYKPAIR